MRGNWPDMETSRYCLCHFPDKDKYNLVDLKIFIDSF